MNLIARLRTNARLRLGTELAALLVLGGGAWWLWSAPARKDAALSRAPLQELKARIKAEPENARLGYWLGVRKQQLGDLSGARDAFRIAASLDGDDEDIWLGWASVAGAMGTTQEAFSVLRVFTEKHPNSERARMALAIFYHEQNARLRALEEAQAAVRINPKNAVGWRLLGTEALELRRFPEAEDALKKALALDPKDWRSRLALGTTLKHLKRPAEALAAFEEAARLAPKESIPRRAVGRARLDTATNAESLKAAESDLRAALAIEPRDSEAMLLLGQCLTRQSRHEEALAEWEKAATLSPDSARVFYELSRAYRRRGDTARAEDASKRHKMLDSFDRELYSLQSQLYQLKEDTQVRLKIARLLASRGRDAEAAREYRRLIARAPKLAVAQKELAAIEKRTPNAAIEAIALPGPRQTGLNLPLLLKDAQALLDKRDFAAAERAFARVLSVDRNSAPGYTGLGLALLARGQEEEAFQALQRALQLEERQPRALYGLASLFLKIDFPDEAIRRLRRAVEIDPKDAECWFLLGVSLRDVGRSDAAEEALRRAVALRPEGRYLANLAWTQGRAGRTDEAKKNFEAAVAASPKDSVVLGLYGGTLVEEAEKTRASAVIQRAEKLLSDALQADAGNYNAHYSLGSLALLQGDAKKAVPHLESAIQSQPGMLQAWFRLAKAYTKLGNKERADYCQKVFKATSDYELERSSAEEQARTDLKNPALRLKLARTYVRGSEMRRALNQYGMYLTLKPGDTAVQKERDALVELLRKQGRLPQMELFERMLRSSTEAQDAAK